MRSVTIIFLAVLAMSFAQDKVIVVEHASGQSPVIRPDSGFYRPPNGPGHVNLVPNPDSYYSQAAAAGPYEPISQGPTFVNDANTRPPYPYKKYDNPYARGGK